MPYKLVHESDGWYVVSSDTGEKKNDEPYPSREAALPYFKKLWSVLGDEKRLPKFPRKKS